MNFKNFTADFYADIGEKFAGKRNISAKIIFKTGLKIKYNFNSTFQMKQLLRVNTAHAAKVKIQLYIHTFRAERCGIAISDSQENIHAGLTNLHLSNLPALEKKKKRIQIQMITSIFHWRKVHFFCFLEVAAAGFDSHLSTDSRSCFF